MIYKSMKVMYLSLKGDADFFDFVTGVLEKDKIAAFFLFLICLDQ